MRNSLVDHSGLGFIVYRGGLTDPKSRILAKLIGKLRSEKTRGTVITSSSKGLVGGTDKGWCTDDQVPSLTVFNEHSKTS
jgi:hypothetical protein